MRAGIATRASLRGPAITTALLTILTLSLLSPSVHSIWLSFPPPISNPSLTEIPLITDSNSTFLSASANRYSFVFNNPTDIYVRPFDDSLDARAFQSEEDAFSVSSGCFTNMDVCVFAGSFEVRIYNVKDGPLYMSTVAMFASPPNFEISRIAIEIIQNSEYFLVGTYSHFGLMRVHYRARQTWAGLKDPSFPHKAAVSSLLSKEGTATAYVSFEGASSVYSFDVVNMHPSTVGQISLGRPLGPIYKFGLNKELMLSHWENDLLVIDPEAKIVAATPTNGFVRMVSPVPNSYFLVTVHSKIWRLISLKSGTIEVFKETVSSFNIHSIVFSEYREGFLMVGAGNALFLQLEIKTGLEVAIQSDCHPACSGCSKPFLNTECECDSVADPSCQVCAAGYILEKEQCLTGSLTKKDEDERNFYSSQKWSRYDSFSFSFDPDAYPKKYRAISVYTIVIFALSILFLTTLIYSCFNCGRIRDRLTKARRIFVGAIFDRQLVEEIGGEEAKYKVGFFAENVFTDAMFTKAGQAEKGSPDGNEPGLKDDQAKKGGEGSNNFFANLLNRNKEKDNSAQLKPAVEEKEEVNEYQIEVVPYPGSENKPDVPKTDSADKREA